MSKGSIERGVKKRKRTERDHDGSDFVYSKQKKKSIEEMIPQVEAQSLTSIQQRKATLNQKTGI